MKNKLILGAICAIAVTVFSCQKDLRNETKSEEIKSNSKSKEAIAIINYDFPIKIKFKPYRPIDTRPRDGQDCGCVHCLGACDFEIILGQVDQSYKDIIVTLDEQNSKATLYCIENLNHFEQEFEVDYNLVLPNARNSQNQQVKVLSGMYNFIEVQESIVHQGTTYLSYGKVVLDVAQC